MRSRANASSPASTACSKSRRPRASREIADLACLAEAKQRDSVHDLARAATIPPSMRRRGARGQADQVDADALARERAQMAPGPAVDLRGRRVRRLRSWNQRLLHHHEDLSRRRVRSRGGAARPRECADADCRQHRTGEPGSRRRHSTSASISAGATKKSGRSTIVTTDGANLRLEKGGERLFVDGVEHASQGPGEYPDIYRHFVELIDERRSYVDIAPLRLVADCLLVGSTRTVEEVHDVMDRQLGVRAQ